MLNLRSSTLFSSSRDFDANLYLCEDTFGRLPLDMFTRFSDTLVFYAYVFVLSVMATAAAVVAFQNLRYVHFEISRILPHSFPSRLLRLVMEKNSGTLPLPSGGCHVSETSVVIVFQIQYIIGAFSMKRTPRNRIVGSALRANKHLGWKDRSTATLADVMLHPRIVTSAFQVAAINVCDTDVKFQSSNHNDIGDFSTIQ